MQLSARPPAHQAPKRRLAGPAAVAALALLIGGIAPVAVRTFLQPDAAQAAVPASATDETKVPHYFGPYPNWANSPQTLADAMVTISVGTPTPVLYGNPLTERKYATDYAKPTGELGPVLVVLDHTKLPAGTLNDFQTWNQGIAGASPTTSADSLFHALVLRPTGTMGEYTVVFASDELKVPTPTVNTGEVETYSMPAVAVQKDDVIGFYGQGVPVDTDVPANGDTLSTPASGDLTLATNIAPAANSTVKLGASNYPDFSHDRTYSFAADVTPTITDPGTGAEATASVDPKTGAISGVTVTSPGAGYAVSPTVKITTAGVTPTTVAKATAKIATGVITSIDVNETGYGFTSPVVTLTGGNPTAGAEAHAQASGTVDNLKLTDGGKGYQAQPLVNISKPDLAGGEQATGSATMDSNGVVTAVEIANAGSGYTSAPTVTLTDASKTAPDQEAKVDATIGVTRIDVTDGGAGYDSAPTVTIADSVGTADKGASATAKVAVKGSVTDIVVTTPGAGYLTPGIKKFVDTLPGEGEANANDLGQYIPVAVPDTTTYPGTDYYEIAVVQYRMKFHRDLPATLLRGYVQLSTGVVPGKKVALANANLDPTLPDSPISFTGVDKPHYLGPTIIATKNKPVRVLFRNLLPTGVDGDLFLPVDTSVMGSGDGPDMMTLNPTTKVPEDMAKDEGSVLDGVRNPMCGQTPKPTTCYSENRATLHLHGGITPWISDGTPHQWVTPTGENTAYPKGVSVSNVPDMPDPGPGAETFFYTNQQSARMMFYHDHSWGITRLNVYAGEEAGYMITDDTEQKLMAPGGALEGLGMGTSLTIQDKTFVPSATRMAQLDPTWDPKKWGGEGNLWQPHVYMPAQNPGDPSGMSAFGRWFYGPWFWPPAKDAKYPPMANPYFDPTCDPNVADFCEPALIPSTPNNSVGMEAFHDTPVVNGTAYPTTTMEPKSYRFRILNGSDDRFWNLSWYVADPATGTEVALKSSEVALAQTDTSIVPTPDTTKSSKGPDWIQIGNEGGFLPTPAVVPAHETTWITDPTRFDVGNVDQHSLLLAPAERADVIVDFSAYKGKTLILYNDAPAAFPGRIPGYDYYTGGPDLAPSGAPTTLPGYGPDTRSVMQVKVSNTAPALAFDRPNTTADQMGKLMAAFDHHTDAAGKPAGVFESSQNPIVVGQAAYNKAYGTSFVGSGACNATSNPAAKCDGFARIAEQGGDTFKFDTLSGNQLGIPIEGKSVHDEMNSANFDEWGRMSGNIGLEAPGATPLLQNVILYPYVNPATEKLDGTKGTNSLNVTPISTNADGTQIWKITHNGVDTHPLHFHLNDVQVLNRVTWDNIIIPPEPTELGWKDTVRVSPLEDTIVAVRPILPKLPFAIPDSIRPLNPMMPLGAKGSTTGPNGSEAGFNNTDTNGDPIDPISNVMTNFGWEYVWHCHILSHEEMDMMRPISVSAPRTLPDASVMSFTRPTTDVLLSWTDGTPVSITDPTTWGNAKNEIGYRIERAPIVNGTLGAYVQFATTLANVTTYTDVTAGTGEYAYRVTAWNAAGNTVSAPVLTASTTPKLTAQSPAAGANGVATSVRPTVTFSEAVTGVSSSTFTLKQGSTAVPATVTYSTATRTATLIPTAALTADKPYTLAVTTAIKSVSGGSVAATSWSFTTGPSPTVTTTNPAAGATGIGLGTATTRTPLSATFSEAVSGLPATAASTPNFTLKLGATTIASKVAYNATTRVATLTPDAPLVGDRSYTLTLTNAVKDLVGNQLTAKTWTFITGPAPVVAARTPGVNATGVSRTANITATFSEAVTGLPSRAAASANFTIKRTSTGAAFASVVSYSSTTRVATLNPSGTLLANTQYTVTLNSGIKDTAGNLLAPVTWNFTTGN
ncbi:Ig-like domain-containing protein [Cryobacterium sp. PH31-L1]|uniref:Ig-like domain-containing protein n=1 Tax=Cryobacterium sp. PH31-L1 TaxID=3046199 RepID=UPI0024BB7B18|nr:Ig-like domain-containing protein [Cryobacterium sp. PH31-L1]MDJ0378318.1 Ig-like domain-containing protein [Cryobacterium sp. PH31-L1]